MTVTTTKLMQNMMWAMTIVVKPGLIRRFRNWASNAAPSTTSGVAIGRNSSRLADARNRKR